MRKLEAEVNKEDEEELLKMKKEAQRYTRGGFKRELQIAGLYYSFLGFNDFRCIRQDVLDIIENKMYYFELIDMYTEIILCKVELEGKCRNSFEIFPSETFNNYLDYIKACGISEDNFYDEMLPGKFTIYRRRFSFLKKKLKLATPYCQL